MLTNVDEIAGKPRRRRDVSVFSVQLFTVPSLAVNLVSDARYGQLEQRGVVVRGAGLLDGMLQWLLQHVDECTPGPGGLRRVDVDTQPADEPAPPLDECVDFRARMLGKSAHAWRRMTIDL